MSQGLIEETREAVNASEIGSFASYRRVASLVHEGRRLSGDDWKIIGKTYQPFSTRFPGILRGLIDRLENMPQYVEAHGRLKKILEEESGKNEKDGLSHAEMFRRFLAAAGAGEIGNEETEAASKLFIELEQLYLTDDVEVALGAQTAFELIGDEIIRHFSVIAFLGIGANFERKHLRYFDVHLVAEADHVDLMMQVADAMKAPQAKKAYHYGAFKAASALKAFWSELWQQIPAGRTQGKLFFLSWSGDTAKEVAENLRNVLTDAEHGIPGLTQDDFFHSDMDIVTGNPWFDDLDKALASAEGGIIVLTPESARSAWVHFEAGELYQRQHDLSRPDLQGNLHIVVLGSKQNEFLEKSPLKFWNVKSGRSPELLVKGIWKSVKKNRPSEHPSPERIKDLSGRIKTIIDEKTFEADREYEAQHERTCAWLRYLLSLSASNPKCSDKIPGAPDTLKERAHVAAVARLLIYKYMGSRIRRSTRVYLATRLSEEDWKSANRRYCYRILYSTSGTEGHWKENCLIGQRSSLHKCFSTGTPQKTPPENANLKEELDIYLHPIKLGRTVVCVLGLSCKYQDVGDTLQDLCQEFEYIFSWFVSIISARVRRDGMKVLDFQPLENTPSQEGRHDGLSDQDIAEAMDEMFRLLEEGASFEEGKIREGLGITDSEAYIKDYPFPTRHTRRDHP